MSMMSGTFLLRNACVLSLLVARAGMAEEKPASPSPVGSPMTLEPRCVVEVPELPGRFPHFYMRTIGLYSDGKTGGVGDATYYLIAQYGGDGEDGFRPVILDSMEGFHFRVSLHDLDADGVPELVVEFLQGADTPWTVIYSFRAEKAERRFRWYEGVNRLFCERGSIARWNEDGSFDVRAPWHHEMKGEPPAPVRHVMREGQILVQP